MNPTNIESLFKCIQENYAHINITDIHFTGSGLHHNYRVDTYDGPLHARVYRRQWKQQDEIEYELSALHCLIKQGAEFVSYPLVSKVEKLYSALTENNEIHFTALFAWAEGSALKNKMDETALFNLGATAAKLHIAGTGFQHENTPTTRKLDLNYLGLEAYCAIAHYLNEPQKEVVKKVIEDSEKTFQQLGKATSTQCILSGDINLQNFHVTENGETNLFDFDQCGWGYRVFDIAKFKSSLYREEKSNDIFKEFLNGYESVNQLTQVEHNAIENLERLAIVWVMAIHAWNKDIVGTERLGVQYWELQVKRLKFDG